METAERIKQFLYGNGSGNEDGNGSGDGYGSGSGDGSGDGYGSGSGSGNGYGNGDGYGNGYGSGDGITILQEKEVEVYEVDGIPCRFERIHNEWAKVIIIAKDDFSERTAFVAKYENCIAHGETIRDAMQDAREKYFSSLDSEQVKEKLLAEFREKEKLTVAELYKWHGILTGSCRFGRSQFQEEHDLKDDDTLSLEEFVKLCGDAYGGEKIKELCR